MTRTLTIGAAGVLALGLVAAVIWFRPEKTPLSRDTQRAVDSFDLTKKEYRTKRDTLYLRDTVFRTIARREATSGAETRRLSDDLRKLADAKAMEAANAQTARDSAARWEAAAMTYKAEADTAHVEAVHFENAYRAESTAHVAASMRANLTSERLTASEGINLRMAADLARSSPPCRMLGLLKCPSRKSVALVSVAAGVGAALYAKTLLNAVRP